MHGRNVAMEMIWMLSTTAALATGVSLACGGVLVAFAALLQ
jgi:hypothetical protein